MASDPLSDTSIAKSWLKNATPWTAAVRRNEIASRALVTNQAIIDAVLSRSPRTILDIGCGEGWLSRALAAHGVEAIGVDVVPDLIEEANEAGGGDFRVVSYEQIAAGQLKVRVDVAVANFSLIGKESVEGVVRRAPALIKPGGSLVIRHCIRSLPLGASRTSMAGAKDRGRVSAKIFPIPRPGTFERSRAG